jgi:hypothetical protein
MKLNRMFHGVAVVAMLFGCGCSGFSIPTADELLVSGVSAKAEELALDVGGEGGFGGMMMAGFADHVPGGLGFWQADDLAPEGSMMTVRFYNDSDTNCTFDLSYIAARMDLDEQETAVDVVAGDDVTVEIDCAEIVGLGSLDTPGDVGCRLEDGEEFDNLMVVPGFLNLDYACGGMYSYYLQPDVDDVDGDGDTEELIVFSDALLMHLEDGGPTAHQHGFEMGMMMGGHMPR